MRLASPEFREKWTRGLVSDVDHWLSLFEKKKRKKVKSTEKEKEERGGFGAIFCGGGGCFFGAEGAGIGTPDFIASTLNNDTMSPS